VYIELIEREGSMVGGAVRCDALGIDGSGPASCCTVVPLCLKCGVMELIKYHLPGNYVTYWSNTSWDGSSCFVIGGGK
jgi:hypothetical protein